jgi:uncharacterized protein DUF1707
VNDDHLRIGDAERERAAAALGEHYVQGRLTADEHGERLDRIWAARTRADLQPVFGDLPDPRRTTSRAPAVRRGLPVPVLVVLAALVVLTVVTHLPFVVAGILVVLLVRARRRHRSVWTPMSG